MSDPHHKDRDQRSPESSSQRAPVAAEPSGRIAYDDRGNSIWEWKLGDGEYSRDINTQRLKQLDLNELSLAETAQHPLCEAGALHGSAPTGKRSPGGFNPYDNSSTGSGNVRRNGAASPYNSVGRGALKADTKPPAPARTPQDLRRLNEWMALRKRVEQNKREDGDG